MANTNVTLADYLVGPAPIPEASVLIVADDPQATPAAVVQELVEQTPPPVNMAIPLADDVMRTLMAHVKRIGMCAKDLHYRAKGKPFYGLHMLSDLIYQVEDDTDHIAEIYFMGDRGIEPPRMDEVFRMAIELPVVYPKNDQYFVGGLMDICLKTMHLIEDIKKNYEVKSGVAAVLDKISEHCLLAIGLLDQTMKGD